jgi:hypothetical protein
MVPSPIRPMPRLAHLAEHVGLLDSFHDGAVADPDVVEEAGLEGSLGRRRAVEPASGCAADGAVGQDHVAAAEDVGQFHAQGSGRPFHTRRTESLA